MKLIKYKLLSCEINHGTEEEPNIEQIFQDKIVGPMAVDVFESNLATAKAEAYNGEVEVEEVPDVETEPTTDDILNAILGVE